MIITLSKFSRYFFLTILTALLFAACQKDDSLVDTAVELETADHHHNQETSYIKIQDVPHIKNFLDTESNGRSLFEIDKSVYNRQTRSNEPNLVIGELQTTEIIRVTNGVRSNYTFKLTTVESNNPNGISIFNLIVVENSQGLFSYITEYRPTLSWYDTYRNNNDFSSFTGEMLYFTIDGSYMAKAILDQGTITFAETRNPCDPNDNNDDTNGGGGGGDGGPGGDGGDGGGNGDGGDGGNGGVDIDIYEVCEDCFHPEHNPHQAPCAHPICYTIIDINFTDTANNNENYLLDPCDDIIVDCADDVGDPCTCNAAGDGCADEPDDNDDPVGIGILLDTACFSTNNSLSDNSPFNVNFENVNPCSSDQIDLEEVENNAKFMCIYEALANSEGFKDLFIDTFGQSIEANITFELVDFPSLETAGIIDFPAGAQDVENQIIKLNVNRLNSKHSLDFARTIIHEAIHAYLNVQVFECANGTTVDALNNQDLEELLISMNYECITSADSDHDIMFQGFIPVMEQILNEAFNDLVGMEHLTPDINYYPPPSGDLHPFNWDNGIYFLSVDGLGETNAFDEQISNNPTQDYLFDKYLQDINNPNSLNQNNPCDE